MYSLNMPVAKIRTKIRQEFERHRYVKQLGAVDVLIGQSHMEYQVRFTFTPGDLWSCGPRGTDVGWM